jgi:hypothetical protein
MTVLEPFLLVRRWFETGPSARRLRRRDELVAHDVGLRLEATVVARGDRRIRAEIEGDVSRSGGAGAATVRTTERPGLSSPGWKLVGPVEDHSRPGGGCRGSPPRFRLTSLSGDDAVAPERHALHVRCGSRSSPSLISTVFAGRGAAGTSALNAAVIKRQVDVRIPARGAVFAPSSNSVAGLVAPTNCSAVRALPTQPRSKKCSFYNPCRRTLRNYLESLSNI